MKRAPAICLPARPNASNTSSVGGHFPGANGLQAAVWACALLQGLPGPADMPANLAFVLPNADRVSAAHKQKDPRRFAPARVQQVVRHACACRTMLFYRPPPIVLIELLPIAWATALLPVTRSDVPVAAPVWVTPKLAPLVVAETAAVFD